MWGHVVLIMTVQGQVFKRFATCSARVSANNMFTVSKRDVQTTNLEPGDDVRVLIIEMEGESTEPDPIDRDVFEGTLQSTNQITIPKDTVGKLDLDTGDMIRYIVVPKKSFPGLRDGPVRNRVKSSGSEQMQESVQRETTTDSFSRPMQKTGQVTVPADTMDKMALTQGDVVIVTIMGKGEDTTVNKEIGTGNRITISQDERDELGLEPGDEPLIEIAVLS